MFILHYCLHTHIYISICMYTSVCANICIDKYIYVCVYVCMLIYTAYIAYILRYWKINTICSFSFPCSFTWIILGDDTRPAPSGFDPRVHVGDTWECHEAMGWGWRAHGQGDGPGHKWLLDHHIPSSIYVYDSFSSYVLMFHIYAFIFYMCIYMCIYNIYIYVCICTCSICIYIYIYIYMYAYEYCSWLRMSVYQCSWSQTSHQSPSKSTKHHR